MRWVGWPGCLSCTAGRIDFVAPDQLDRAAAAEPSVTAPFEGKKLHQDVRQAMTELPTAQQVNAVTVHSQLRHLSAPLRGSGGGGHCFKPASMKQ
jgi:hypothetical protein